MFRKFFTMQYQIRRPHPKTALLFRCGQSGGRPVAINLTMNCIARKDLQDENALFPQCLQPVVVYDGLRTNQTLRLEGGLARPLRARPTSPASKQLVFGGT